MSRNSYRINVGCGMTPTPGFVNLDGSPGVRLSRFPLLGKLLRTCKIIDRGNYEFMQFAAQHGIRYANAAKKLPFADDAVEVVYSSHMYEHLLKHHADKFLQESFRVLEPNGIIRLAVPNLRPKAEEYLRTGDANAFLESTLLCEVWNKLSTFRGVVQLILFGHPSAHKWMYDGTSLCNELRRHGFDNARELPPGETTIPTPGALNLYERCPESVFVEARKPSKA